MRITRQITTAISISMALVLLFTILFSYYSMNRLKHREIEQVRQTLLEERKRQLRHLLQNAYSVLETSKFYEPAQAAISKMRFGENNQDYFFVVDHKGMFWVNPAHPELVGDVHMDLKDVNGDRYIEKIINTANLNGDHFTEFQFYRPGSSRTSTKLIHFKAYKKWNWILCAGLFIDDIETLVQKKEAQIHTVLIQQIGFFALGELIILIFCGLFCLRFFRVKLVTPLEKITQAAEDMVAGNFDNDIHVRSCQEINQLVDAMECMQDSFTIAYDRLSAKILQNKAMRYVNDSPDKSGGFELTQFEEHLSLKSAS